MKLYFLRSTLFMVVLLGVSAVLHFTVSASAPQRMTELFYADLQSGERFSKDALTSFIGEERARAGREAKSLADRIGSGAITPDRLKRLLDRLGDAYEDGQLTLSELRHISRELQKIQ